MEIERHLYPFYKFFNDYLNVSKNVRYICFDLKLVKQITYIRVNQTMRCCDISLTK